MFKIFVDVECETKDDLKATLNDIIHNATLCLLDNKPMTCNFTSEHLTVEMTETRAGKIGEPYQINGNWYVDIEGSTSGPWNTRKAAEFAGEGEFKKAQLAHNIRK